MSAPRTSTEMLREARRLLAEEGWTQGWYARDANGEILEVDGPHEPGQFEGYRGATCYCSLGALQVAAGDYTVTDPQSPAAAAVICLAQATDVRIPQSIPAWNDSLVRTKAQVLAAYDSAIKLAGESA